MSIRVVLVDDHQLLREGLCAILATESDMEVVGEAEDGRSAIDLVHQLCPDVVVMDIGMGDMNGLEATRQIKQESGSVKVVVLSTYSDKHYVLGMLEAGAEGYVVKAGAYDELRRAIHVVAEGKVYLSPAVADRVVSSHLQLRFQGDAYQHDPLSAREREVLQLLAEGHTSGGIAHKLHVSTSTVETHRRNLMRKLDVHSVAELTKYAVREGLTTLGG